MAQLSLTFEEMLVIYEYLLVGFGALFLSHGISSTYTFYARKFPLALQQMILNYSCFLYCVGLFTFSFQFLTGGWADFISNIQWYVAGFALTSYLSMISEIFPNNKKVYDFGKKVIYGVLFLFVLDQFKIIELYKFRFESFDGVKPVFLNSVMDLTPLGYIPAAVLSINTVVMNLFTLKEFIKTGSKEYLIFFGIFATLFAVVNDILISVMPDYGLFPIFYIGSIFETVRFSNYIKEKSWLKIEDLKLKNKLKEEKILEAKFNEILLNTLAHDINNGLSIAKYGAVKLKDLIDNDDLSNDKMVNFVSSKILTGIGSIESIRAYIMNLQKARSLKESIYLTDFSLEDIINKIILDNQPISAEKEISISLKGDFSAMIRSDRTILQNHIFPNLISNAIKFSPMGEKLKSGVTKLMDAHKFE